MGLLVLGLTGGVALGIERRAQEQITASGQAAINEADQINQLRQDQADQWRAGAGQRAAQADAQAKAVSAAGQAAAKEKSIDSQSRSQGASRSQTRPYSYGPVPSSCSVYNGTSEPAKNQALGCTLLLAAGFGLDQMPCLINMWNKESGWHTKAQNPSSGAYGIPQALPGSKMGTGWQTDPSVQIKWGLGYIKNRYSTPCGAWDYWQAHGWY
ncbi:MAG: lytic transglycosylase domain-containing protein [Micromonosporaceae bacterium]|nr:lytic transglycosylase domain-containing protein [Micromonosporaceae bacterium]